MTQPVFDANTRSIAERKIKGVLDARIQKFGYKLADLHGQFVKAGGVRGSAHQQVIRDACKTELRERLQAAWEILRNIAIDFSLLRSPASAEELKALMRHFVLGSTSDLRQAIELTKGGSGAADGRADVTVLIEQVLPETEADIDFFISTASVRREQLLQGQRPAIDPRRLFMSHAAADKSVAILLKQEIERRIPGLSVFCSGYPGDIRLGFRWSAEIQQSLQEASALILVATSRSIERHWIWFESGTFWFDRPIVICCLGDLRPEKIPPPLGERQAVALASAEELRLLLTQLSQIAGLAVTNTDKLDTVVSELLELERKAQSESDTEQGWVGVPWQGNFLVYDGPIEELNLIDPEYYQESMKAPLEAAGFRLVLIRRDQIGEYKDRGAKPVYVTDKKKWRKEIQLGDVILVAKPRENE